MFGLVFGLVFGLIELVFVIFAIFNILLYCQWVLKVEIFLIQYFPDLEDGRSYLAHEVYVRLNVLDFLRFLCFRVNQIKVNVIFQLQTNPMPPTELQHFFSHVAFQLYVQDISLEESVLFVVISKLVFWVHPWAFQSIVFECGYDYICVVISSHIVFVGGFAPYAISLLF